MRNIYHNKVTIIRTIYHNKVIVIRYIYQNKDTIESTVIFITIKL